MSHARKREREKNRRDSAIEIMGKRTPLDERTKTLKIKFVRGCEGERDDAKRLAGWCKIFVKL